MQVVIVVMDALFLSTLSLRRATDLEPSSTRKLTFLSTLSLRRATLAGPSGPAFLYNFYPRSPCGERPQPTSKTRQSWHFYPRSPCGERRCNADYNYRSGYRYFYPRSPCGERQASSRTKRQGQRISIHALLAESDASLI